MAEPAGLIQSDTMKITTNSSIVQVLTAVGAAAGGIFGTTQTDNTAVRVATIAAVAAIVIASLALHYFNIMGDRTTRAAVTTAFIEKTGRVPTQKEIKGEVESASPATGVGEGGFTHLSAMSGLMAVEVAGRSGKYWVSAIGCRRNGTAEVLVGKAGERPEWVELSKISSAIYQFDPTSFPMSPATSSS